MCGRYQLNVEAAALAATHPNATWHPNHAKQHKPRQQVRPTTQAPVLVHETSNPTFQLMKWGFSRGGSPLINARKETVLELPTFRPQMRRRCAIPVTGFYEWQKEAGPGKPSKTPFLIRSIPKAAFEDVSVAYMAGIYRTENENGQATSKFVVLTEKAASELEWLHNRQPVFLRSEKQVEEWLRMDASPTDAVKGLVDGTGFSWWRMAPDLADKYRGKVMKQKGIDAFFGSKAKTKDTQSLRVKSRLKKNKKATKK
ncbi:putative SOS response-associated peptidase yoqW [Gracilariopsis chorda]|uniref:Putative SOS response-associated peptidase yoqW n=1 Tax=Gracilariopsis chorda TaxID=448386 RepID=A0A2V3IKF6_9FLOR|nr:putative SOS response-associated peptidase yoqW [Gracilariopsis chorda]|eukprot:PXF42575.1 putative SOS response-associated peptidase yoqW [Gracilariopsis chorda]